jgi:hypothetical protein
LSETGNGLKTDSSPEVRLADYRWHGESAC